jgi:salicylate hydroxylase
MAEFHVCVVGAGIVGLASSILLLREGFKVTVLEKDASLQVSSHYDVRKTLA